MLKQVREWHPPVGGAPVAEHSTLQAEQVGNTFHGSLSLILSMETEQHTGSTSWRPRAQRIVSRRDSPETTAFQNA